MSITADRRKREFQQREELILAAAREMFEKVGFLNLKMADLARAVEYSTGTLYQHFASKEDLLLAMSAQIHAEVMPVLERIAATFRTSRDRITAFCLGHAEVTRRDPESFRIWQFAIAHSVWMRASEDRREAVERLDDRGRRSLQSIVDDAVATGDLDPRCGSVGEIGLSLFSFLLGTYTVTNEAKPSRMFRIEDAYELLRRNLALYLDTIRWQPVGADADAVYQRVCHELDAAQIGGANHA